MVICPICQSVMRETVCNLCGFDTSLQYEHCGSISEIDGSPMSLTGMREHWRKKHKDLFICPACGGASFLFQEDRMTVLCCKCSVKSEIPTILMMQKELSFLKEECSTRKNHSDALFSRIQSLYGEIENIKADNKKLIIERNSIRRELSAEKEKAEKLFTDLQSLYGELEITRADYNQLIIERNSIRRELSTEKEKTDNSFTKLQSLSGELERLKTENQNLKKQLKKTV